MSQRRSLSATLMAASIGASALLGLAFGCNQSRPAIAVRDTEGIEMCCVLSAECHGVADGTGSAGAAGAHSGQGGQPNDPEACHQLGHAGDPDDCRKYYDHCLDLCDVDAEQAEAAELECQ